MPDHLSTIYLQYSTWFTNNVMDLFAVELI
jgi:hypothetical protein